MINLIALQQKNKAQSLDQSFDHTLDQTVKMFLDAFKKEAFTRALLDLSQRQNYDRYCQAVKYKLSLYREAGHHVFLARDEGSIIGTIILRSPHVSASFGLKLRLIAPYLPAIAGLMPKFMKAAHLASAAKPPENLPKKYYALEGLAVHPDYQGKGVGRLLLEKADQICCEDNSASGIYLLTGDERNKEIYKHFSYQVLETRPAHSFTAYHMFKKSPAMHIRTD